MPLPRFVRRFVRGDGDASPFFFTPPATNRATRGALCLHGFSGTPFEVRPIAEALAAAGYAVAAPVLAGHGGTVEELAATRWTDWLVSAEAALAALRAQVGGGPVAIAGFSLGGLLALRLAQRQQDAVTALAVMAAPLRLRRFEVAALRLLARLPRPLRRGPLFAIPKTRGYDVVDEAMQRRNPGLEAMPVMGAVSLVELGALVRADLRQVRTPTLVVHGAHDRTVPFADSLELAAGLGAPEVERLWLPRSGHLLAIDVDGATLIQAVRRFFDRHTGGAALAGEAAS